MASSEELQELIKLGPFLSLNETEAELYIPPGHAVKATNINTQIVQGALSQERGRVNIFDAQPHTFPAGKHMAFVNIVFPCVGPQNKPGILFQGTSSVLSGSVLLTGYYDYTTATVTTVTLGTVFTQAVQYKNVVYTNGGQRFFPGVDNTKMYGWGYGASAISQNVVVNWTYAIATLGFSGYIKAGDVLTTNITSSGPLQAIPYTVLVSDTDFSILSASIVKAINDWYATGPGNLIANKITAAPLVEFDTANNPGSAAPLAADGVLLTSTASGNIGNTFTITVSSSAGATEGYQTTGTTALGFFFGANVNVGDMLAGTYFYIFTQITTLPDGTTSETSAYPQFFAAPLEVRVGGKTYGNNSAVTFTDTHGPPTYLFTGTNGDGTTYTTNIYRASTNQATFQYTFVGNKADNGTPFVDTKSDAELAGNAIMQVHRDVVPFATGSSLLTNLGFLCVHRNRLWAFVVVDDADTLNQAQVQLWYSNFDRAWEFDDVDQVLLLQANVVVTPEASGPVYADLYGNMPRFLSEVGTTLICSTHRETWVVWGDNSPPGDNPFSQKPIFCYGACSSTALLAVLGGLFFLSESGDLYFYDGNAPAYNSEDIRGALKITSVNAAVTAADLSAACMSYSNRILYVHFPTKGFTLGYDTISSSWTSQLPYAPGTSTGVFSVPSNPSTFGGTGLNEVVAVRNTAITRTKIDWLFADPNNDLGLFNQYSWTIPHTDSGKPDYQKWYSKVRLIAPKQFGSATVSVTVDDGTIPQQTFSCTFDLNQGQVFNTQVLKGQLDKCIGYMAQVTLTVQGVQGKPAPIIWGVGIYGSLNQRLMLLS